MGPPPAPGGKASSAASRGSTHEIFLPRGMSQLPSNQIVPESGAVDHLDRESVRDRVERTRDVHRYGYCSAWGRDHLAETGSRV